MESLATYLAGLKNYSPPHFEVGADLILIERSAGKIDSLIALINPLLENPVISRSCFVASEPGKHPLDSNRSKYYFIGAAAVLVFILSYLMHFLILPSMKTNETEEVDISQPIFLDETTSQKPSIQVPSIKSPTLKREQTEKKPEKDLPIQPTTVQLSKPPITPMPKIEQDPKKIQQVINTVDAWLTAWAARTPDRYVAFYSPEYLENMQEWKEQKVSALIKEAWLKLKRDDLKIKLISNHQAKVEFWLNHNTSGGQRSRIKKQLVLDEANNQWLISSEQNLDVVNRR